MSSLLWTYEAYEEPCEEQKWYHIPFWWEDLLQCYLISRLSYITVFTSFCLSLVCRDHYLDPVSTSLLALLSHLLSPAGGFIYMTPLQLVASSLLRCTREITKACPVLRSFPYPYPYFLYHYPSHCIWRRQEKGSGHGWPRRFLYRHLGGWMTQTGSPLPPRVLG